MEYFSAPKYPFSEMSAGDKFSYWSSIFLAVLYAVTFVCLLYIVVRVIKLVGRSDIVIPHILICLQASCLGKCQLLL